MEGRLVSVPAREEICSDPQDELHADPGSHVIDGAPGQGHRGAKGGERGRGPRAARKWVQEKVGRPEPAGEAENDRLGGWRLRSTVDVIA